MLKELIERCSNIKEPSASLNIKLAASTSVALRLLVDFLRCPGDFPNPAINQLTGLMGRLVEDGWISMQLIIQKEPYADLSLLDSELGDQLILNLPIYHARSVREQPLPLLANTAFIASLLRDDYVAIHVGNRTSLTRAYAFAAETSLTVLRMAQSESIIFIPSEPEQSFLQRFPKGLASLPPRLNYHTPLYAAKRATPYSMLN